MSDYVYLDYAASTPPAPEVTELLHELQAPGANPANPSSMHVAGRRAAAIVQRAVEQLAALVNCDPGRLVWTSGATESDNLAIRGAAAFRSPKGRHLVTMPTEHKAVTDVFRALEKDGYEVSWLCPDEGGILAPERLEAELREDTQLVSVMAVNNETGVVQDIAALGDLCRKKNVLFHVDAAQAAGKLPLDLGSLPVDLVSLTAHKMYGPKGIGALYVADRPGCQVEPLLFGGGQQRGLRPGTLPVPLLAGFGLAAELAGRRMASDRAHLEKLRDALWGELRDLPGIRRNGAPERTFPGILNVSIEDVEGESLLLALEPLCVATGSACNSQSGEPSAVLRALGLSDAMAQSAIRFSFGRPTRLADVEFAAGRYREAVTRLRALAPERAA